MPLRKVVLELNLEAISPLGELLSKFYRSNSSIELIQTLFISDKVIAELVRIGRTSDFYTLDEIAGRRKSLLRKYGLIDFEVLEADAGAGYYTAIIKHRTPPKLAPVMRQFLGSIYLAAPIGVRRGNVTLTLFVEKEKASSLSGALTAQGIPFRIQSVADAFSSGREVMGLTASQLSLVQLANTMGYFEVPRKVSTSDVARIAGVTAPAVSKSVRKVEKILVERLLRETNRL